MSITELDLPYYLPYEYQYSLCHSCNTRRHSHSDFTRNCPNCEHQISELPSFDFSSYLKKLIGNSIDQIGFLTTKESLLDDFPTYHSNRHYQNYEGNLSSFKVRFDENTVFAKTAYPKGDIRVYLVVAHLMAFHLREDLEQIPGSEERSHLSFQILEEVSLSLYDYLWIGSEEPLYRTDRDAMIQNGLKLFQVKRELEIWSQSCQ